MFSSKSKRGSWTWALVDLVVVITGVYIAFLIQSKAAEAGDKKEKIKIYSALKMELEEFRVAFPLFANSNEDFVESIRNKKLHDISGWRYIEPQYGYQIIEYAINIQNSEIIDFGTYEDLKDLFVSIKQLEETERMVTEVSGEYQYLIPEIDESHLANLERKANNRARLFRFKMFMSARVDILRRIAESSKPLLAKINDVLGEDLVKEIDEKYIAGLVSWVSNEQDALDLIQEYYPGISEEEARKLYEKAILVGNAEIDRQ